MNPEKVKNIKIILSGLDNAGKSSMLIGLRRLYGFEEDVSKLKPTIRIDYYRRKFLNLQLNFFDMGGQKKFRTAYLKRPIYFEAVNLFIYLIDIQDEERFTESIEYLGDILKILDEVEYDHSNPIYICFSKADPELLEENFVDLSSRMEMIKGLIKSTYPNFNFKYFSTSIYNVYSIVKMISSGLKNHLDFYEEIHNIVESYGKRTNVKVALFFDSTGLIIADYFQEDEDNDKDEDVQDANQEIEKNDGIVDDNTLMKLKNNNLQFILQNNMDQIISGHLAFFKQIEDDLMEITSSRGVNNEWMNCCYQFILDKNDDSNKIDINNMDDSSEKTKALNVEEEIKVKKIEKVKSKQVEISGENNDSFEHGVESTLNPRTQRYYFSIIAPLETSIPAENEIPEILDELRNLMLKLLEK